MPNIIAPSKLLGKRKAPAEEGEDDSEADSDSEVIAESKPKASQKAKRRESFPGGGRRGVSSGLSTVVKHGGDRSKNAKNGAAGPNTSGGRGKGDWWTTLGGVGASAGQRGSKGSMKISRES